MSEKRIPTMKEIAELAGVSKSTVSRALANDPRVNENTRARIKEIASRLDYRLNAMASGLARRRTHTLGLVIPMAPRSISDPFYLEFLGGIGDCAFTKGYSLLLSTLYPSESDTPGHVILAEKHRVDGLILTEPMIDDQRIEYLRKRSIPFVFLGNSGDSADLLWVNGDNVAGARMATEHLILQGHSRIGCIAGPQELVHGRDRLLGYKTAIAASGLNPHPDYVAYGDFTQNGGYEAMKALAKIRPRVSAVFASNDLMALGAIRAAHEMSLRVPEDLSIVGFDGIHLAEYTNPPLSTVRQPIYEMGYKAADMLIRTLAGEEVAQRKVTFPMELIVRGSSQPLTDPASMPRTK